MKYPKYLIRPDDYTVFSLRNKDGDYSIKKDDFISHKYQTLIKFDFFEATDNDLPELKKKNDLYYEWLNWTSRSDGHGGTKGGSFEEFLKKKKNN